jgi:hypothetical protein
MTPNGPQTAPKSIENAAKILILKPRIDKVKNSRTHEPKNSRRQEKGVRREEAKKWILGVEFGGCWG